MGCKSQARFDELKEIQQTSLLKSEFDGGLSVSLTQVIGLHVWMRDVVIRLSPVRIDGE